MSAPHQSLVQPGDIVDGYKVGPLFAKEGGMSLVYLVEDPALPRLPLVMKVLPTDSPAQTVARMEREAHALSMLSSARHVVRVHTTGKCPDGSPYIILEKLAGEDLAKRLKRDRRLEVARAVEIAVQASMGIHACHVEGVLHRDVKPGNIFLHQEAELGEMVKIIDFGISHPGTGPAITGADSTTGTRRYMALEQARGQDDERSDQFSLAAVLFEMLAGELPWPLPKKDDGGAHERLLLQGKYKQLRTLRPEVPERLEAVILRALSPKPDGRFASVFEFAKELLPFASPEAQSLFRKYAENVGRVRAAVTAVPISQQETVRRTYVPEPSVSIEVRKAPGPTRGPSESEYATVASGGQPRSTRGRRYLIAGAGVAIIAAALTWGLRGAGRVDVGDTAKPPMRTTHAVPEVRPIPTPSASPGGGHVPLPNEAPGLPSGPDTRPTAEVVERAETSAKTERKKPSKKGAGLRRGGGLLRTPQGTAIPD